MKRFYLIHTMCALVAHMASVQIPDLSKETPIIIYKDAAEADSVLMNMKQYDRNSPQTRTSLMTPPVSFHLSQFARIPGNTVLDPAFQPVHHTVHMKAITYTAARENLATTMERVCVDHDPVIITRNRDQAVVMLSLDDYESLQETAYLLRSPANAKRLLASIESLNAGKIVRKRIEDLVKA